MVEDDQGRRPATKSTLIVVSHAIEQAALATAEDGPMVVFALFQRMAYFERERDVYQRIAARSAATIVGVVDVPAAEPPQGFDLVALDSAESLAREWTIAVLTPRFGAVLAAVDRETVDASAATLETGRVFAASWALRRDAAMYEVQRLRRLLAPRLPSTTVGNVDAALDRIRDLPAGQGETRADAVARLFADRFEREYRRGLATRARRPVVQQLANAGSHGPVHGDGSATLPGVLEESEFRRWALGGTVASGTLAVSLIGVRADRDQTLPYRLGRRVAGLASLEVARTLAGVIGPTDRVARLGDDDFLLVLPGMRHDDAVALAYRITSGGMIAPGGDAGLQFAATAAVTSTRERPFPLDAIVRALDWAVQHRVPVAALPE